MRPDRSAGLSRYIRVEPGVVRGPAANAMQMRYIGRF